MKRIMAFVCAIICLLMLSGCSPIVGNSKTDDEWGVLLLAKDVTSTGMTILCAQGGVELDGNLLSGSYYRLEWPRNGAWVRVRSNGTQNWTDVGWTVRKNGMVEWKENWESMYGSLAPGQYRVAKKFSYTSATGVNEEKEYYLEFTVEG